MLTKTLRGLWFSATRSGGTRMACRPRYRNSTQALSKVKKAFEVLGGKWSRQDNATIFNEDPPQQIESLVTNGVLSVARVGFFRTPKDVIWRMLSLMPWERRPQGYNGLEPSAGDGAIVEVLQTEQHPVQRIRRNAVIT